MAVRREEAMEVFLSLGRDKFCPVRCPEAGIEHLRGVKPYCLAKVEKRPTVHPILPWGSEGRTTLWKN